MLPNIPVLVPDVAPVDVPLVPFDCARPLNTDDAPLPLQPVITVVAASRHADKIFLFITL